MYQNMIYVIASLFPPGVGELVKILFICFAIFTVAGVVTAVVSIVNHFRGVIGFGR